MVRRTKPIIQRVIRHELPRYKWEYHCTQCGDFWGSSIDVTTTGKMYCITCQRTAPCIVTDESSLHH